MGKSREPAVVLLTVTYQSAGFIDEWAHSVRALRYPWLRIVVVDSASADGTADRVRALLPEAEVIAGQENFGFARGNNVGLDRAFDGPCDFVLFMNSDAVATPEALDRLLAAAGERTVAIPKILWYFDHRIVSTHAGGFDWTLGLFRDTFHGKPDGPASSVPRELETASFCCALVPRRLFEEVGRFDETFFMYYEETDLLKRARDRGFRIRYVPDAVVYHRESGSSGGGWMTPFKLYYATRNRLYLVRKHQRSRARYALFTLYFWATRVPQALKLLLARRTVMVRAMLLGMLDYYRGRMGRTYEVADFR
jgi:GT2 family glycosyltransferase